MDYVLLAIAVCLGASKNVFTKIVKKKSTQFYDTMKMNVITFFVAFAVVFLLGIAQVKTTFCVPWGLTVGYAVCTLGSQVSLMKAVELGSISVSSLFYSCGFILPTLFGSIYYNEEITVLHIIGLMFIVCSFICSAKKEKGKSFHFFWVLTALGGLFFSGMVGIMQKIFANDYAQYRLDNFLCVSFLWIIVLSTVLMWIAKYKEKTSIEDVANEIDGEKVLQNVWAKYIFTDY